MAILTPIRNVAIIGASGLLGESIINGLRAAQSFNITIISRKSSNSTFPGFTVHKLSDDYPQDELIAALQGQDAAIGLLPGKGVQGQLRIIDATVKAGVKRYIPSGFGLNDVFKDVQDLIWTSKDKGDVITYLKEQEATGMSWTAIAMGSWIDWALDKKFIGIDIEARSAEFWDAGNVKFSASSIVTAGIAVARVLQAPEKTANQFLYIRDWTVSQQDIVTALERLSGETWQKNSIKSADRIARGHARLENGDVDGVYDLIKSAFLVEGLKTNFERDEVLANELLGLPTLSLDEVLAAKLGL